MSKIVDGILKDIRSIPKNLKAKTKGGDLKKTILLSIPYVAAGYVVNKLSWLYRTLDGDMSAKFTAMINDIGCAFKNPLPSLAVVDLCLGIGAGFLFRFIVSQYGKNAKKYRQGREYGSAKWGTAKDIQPYMDPVFQNNLILTETERLQMNGRPSSPKYARNKNVLVIGGSGSGKTRFYCKPNMMQMHSSYVVTDPKGTCLVEVGRMFQNNG